MAVFRATADQCSPGNRAAGEGARPAAFPLGVRNSPCRSTMAWSFTASASCCGTRRDRTVERVRRSSHTARCPLQGLPLRPLRRAPWRGLSRGAGRIPLLNGMRRTIIARSPMPDHDPERLRVRKADAERLLACTLTMGTLTFERAADARQRAMTAAL